MKYTISYHGSSATTALSDEDTNEEDVQEVQEDCRSLGRDDAEEFQAACSSPQAQGNSPHLPSPSPS